MTESKNRHLEEMNETLMARVSGLEAKLLVSLPVDTGVEVALPTQSSAAPSFGVRLAHIKHNRTKMRPSPHRIPQDQHVALSSWDSSSHTPSLFPAPSQHCQLPTDFIPQQIQSHLPQLDFPSFDGTSMNTWVRKAERYFKLYFVHPLYMVKVALMHLSEKAEN